MKDRVTNSELASLPIGGEVQARASGVGGPLNTVLRTGFMEALTSEERRKEMRELGCQLSAEGKKPQRQDPGQGGHQMWSPAKKARN